MFTWKQFLNQQTSDDNTHKLVQCNIQAENIFLKLFILSYTQCNVDY